jgi:major membrane immunogen (membrane-anchored lipoprotein)
MENRTDILNELQSLSPTLVGLQKVNVYTVPLGYFDMLSNDILATLNIEQNNFLPNIKKQIGDVPQGYFNSLADNILTKIKQQQVDNVSEELRSISPMLYSIQNQNVYTVPKNYFENLSDELVEKVQPTQAKVISITKRKFFVIKYAVAAVFTGVIMFGVFKFTATTNSLDESTTKGLTIAKENRFDTELDKISDDEIVKYLEADGVDVDDALLAAVVDEKEIPTQQDNLTDEKTLDSYLDNINLEDLKN